MATKKTTEATNSKERKAYFLEVEVTFTNELLGTNPNNKQIYSEYIAGLADEESRKQEVARIGQLEADEKGMTVFLRNPETGCPQLKAYTWLGYLKERAKGLNGITGTVVSGMKAFVKEINLRVNVEPRFIDLEIPEGEAIGVNERPLRASGPSGEKTALAKSETVPIGTKCHMTFRTETKEGLALIIECLNEGATHGTGQWRNAGFGTFTWEKLNMWSETITTGGDHQDVLDELAAL
jgi:hypothetical protein